MRAVDLDARAFVFAPLMLVLAATTSAQVIASDTFTYADGNLVGNGGWVNHSGTGSFIQVTSGQAVLTHGSGSREDANLPFATGAGNVFYGFDFSVDDLGGAFLGGDEEYFAHFLVGTSTFSARLDVVPPSGAGDFSVGISSDGSTADATWPTDLTYGTTYRVIVRYDQDANIAELWIDASVPSDPSILGDDGTDPGDTVEAFALRQSTSTNNETIRVDNLLVGRTFADCLPVAPCGVPATDIGPFGCPGPPSNPNVLTSGGPPVLGSTAVYTVDTAASGVLGVLDTFLFLSMTNTGACFNCGECPTRFGNLLIDLTPFAIANGSLSDSGPDGGGFTTHSIAVPVGFNLCGEGFSLQAAILGTGSMGSGVRLSNVWDVIVGS